jgi:hypothetical protein
VEREIPGHHPRSSASIRAIMLQPPCFSGHRQAHADWAASDIRYGRGHYRLRRARRHR